MKKNPREQRRISQLQAFEVSAHILKEINLMHVTRPRKDEEIKEYLSDMRNYRATAGLFGNNRRESAKIANRARVITRNKFGL